MFQLSIQNSLKNFQNCQNVEEMWEHLKSALQSSADDVLGSSKPSHKDWFQDNKEVVSKALKKKYEAWKQTLLRKTRRSLLRFKQARAEAKRVIVNAKNKWWQKKTEENEEAFLCGNSFEAYSLIRLLRNSHEYRSRVRSPNIKSKYGDLLTENDATLEQWKEHFSEVLNVDAAVGNEVIDSIEEIVWLLKAKK